MLPAAAKSQPQSSLIVRRGREANRLIKWVAGISTTERKRVPRREQQDNGARQGAERVSRSSKRLGSIVALSNRTASAGQAGQFGETADLAESFGAIPEALGDRRSGLRGASPQAVAEGKSETAGGQGLPCGAAQADQTWSLTDCRLSATVAVSSQLAEKPHYAYGLD